MCTTPFTEQRKLALTRLARGVGGPGAQLSKRTKIKMGKRTQTPDRGTLPRRPASRSRLFTVDIETGVLRVLFNDAAS